MPKSTLTNQLCDTAHYFHKKGWMLGTAGNLSAKAPQQGFWITSSGQNKGELLPEQFLLLSLEGDVLQQPSPSLKPSAETSIHIAVYDLFPQAQACLHVHMLESNWVCDRHPHNWIELPPLEMLKGFGWKGGSARILVTDNHHEVPKIAADLRNAYQEEHDFFWVPGFLIRNHGITTWGADVSQARNRIELFSYIFSYMCGP